MDLKSSEITNCFGNLLKVNPQNLASIKVQSIKKLVKFTETFSKIYGKNPRNLYSLEAMLLNKLFRKEQVLILLSKKLKVWQC